MESPVKRVGELLAGEPYPDIDQVRRDVSGDGATFHEVEQSVSCARRQWAGKFLAMQGLRDLIREGLKDNRLKEEDMYRGDN